ncbi:MAG TPA: glycerol-3-phosphate dehydrogenase/oxidase [Gemmatimonadales bacterium]|nr:glycerol-3-phosphate dehydrogenase/oxidase [Gemmatimonadales bacterium]
MTASVRARVGDLAARELDLLVIGGGITGAGVLRDAALRGLRAGLVERADFGAGTSSRSSRLIHGGLRYLEHRQWRLVFEALRERAILLRLAPHLVRSLAFVFPVYRGDRIPVWKLALGLVLYRLLAAGGNVPRPRIFGKAGLLKLEPNLRVRGLTGGGLYHDAQCDDARLVLAALRSAIARGAKAVNYAAMTRLMSEDGRLVGAEVADQLDPAGPGTVVRARAVVNATGPWTDQIRRMEDPAARPLLRLTSGAHIVVPRSRLGHTRGITFTSPIDGRVMFVLPMGDRSYIGTTDTDFTGDPAAVRITPEDETYLLRSANALFPHAHLGEEDIQSSWAGVRPLLANDPAAHPDALSREHRVVKGPMGLITVTGGKLTTFRRMAGEVVDEVARHLGRTLPQAETDTEPLTGGEATSWDVFIQNGVELGVPTATIDHLIHHFGTESAAILNLIRTDRRLMKPIHPDHPAMEAEVIQVLRRELAVKVDDVLTRRLHLTTETADQGLAAAAKVAELMGRELGWSPEQIAREAAEFESLYPGSPPPLD